MVLTIRDYPHFLRKSEDARTINIESITRTTAKSQFLRYESEA